MGECTLGVCGAGCFASARGEFRQRLQAAATVGMPAPSRMNERAAGACPFGFEPLQRPRPSRFRHARSLAQATHTSGEDFFAGDCKVLVGRQPHQHWTGFGCSVAISSSVGTIVSILGPVEQLQWPQIRNGGAAETARPKGPKTDSAKMAVQETRGSSRKDENTALHA